MLLATRSSSIIPDLVRKYQPTTDLVQDVNETLDNNISWYTMIDFQLTDFELNDLPLQHQPRTWPLQPIPPSKQTKKSNVPRFGVWTF
jgi:hypothetical protein